MPHNQKQKSRNFSFFRESWRYQKFIISLCMCVCMREYVCCTCVHACDPGWGPASQTWGQTWVPKENRKNPLQREPQAWGGDPPTHIPTPSPPSWKKYPVLEKIWLETSSASAYQAALTEVCTTYHPTISPLATEPSTQLPYPTSFWAKVYLWTAAYLSEPSDPGLIEGRCLLKYAVPLSQSSH